MAEVNLVLNAVSGVNYRLNDRVYDFPGVHVDFDFVAHYHPTEHQPLPAPNFPFNAWITRLPPRMKEFSGRLVSYSSS